MQLTNLHSKIQKAMVMCICLVYEESAMIRKAKMKTLASYVDFTFSVDGERI
jgi:hypothetical protein